MTLEAPMLIFKTGSNCIIDMSSTEYLVSYSQKYRQYLWMLLTLSRDYTQYRPNLRSVKQIQAS
jgi:hypothetical protein